MFQRPVLAPLRADMFQRLALAPLFAGVLLRQPLALLFASLLQRFARGGRGEGNAGVRRLRRAAAAGWPVPFMSPGPASRASS
ncbi:hypothetical protein CKO44_02485 [Rubrivivax gelatinosus]|nr:hypothetical protein [Rubrivivax gelatinosus]